MSTPEPISEAAAIALRRFDAAMKAGHPPQDVVGALVAACSAVAAERSIDYDALFGRVIEVGGVKRK